MPYAPHDRLTMTGRLGKTEQLERFSMTINLQGVGLAGVANRYQQAVNDIGADCAAWFARPGTNICDEAVLEEVKVAPIGPDGLYTGDPVFWEQMPGAGVKGGLQVVPMPFQVSWAISLGTDRRGPTGRGRFFQPLPAAAIERATGGVPTAAQTGCRASAVTFLEALNNSPGPDGPGSIRVVVASSKGYNSPVTSVRVGRVLDTIRSRRRSLDESYGPASPIG